MRLRKNLKSLKNAIDLYLALYSQWIEQIFLLHALLISLFVWLIQCCIFDPLLGWCFGHKAHGKKHIRAPFICCYHPLPKNIHISNCTILFKMFFSGQRMPKLYWPSPRILNLILWKCLTQRSSLCFLRNIFMPW